MIAFLHSQIIKIKILTQKKLKLNISIKLESLADKLAKYD